MSPTQQVTVGSLFSGIGGIDLGLQRAGFEIAWQVEIDPYAQKVLAKHWPHVARYGDIRTVGKHNLAPVDLLAGGFPCQDISIAGKGVGITGERSGLWSEFYRVICELRPRFILVENVSALLHRGIERVLGDLAESGYDAEWQVLSAEAFGAPHLRNRIFVVAYTSSKRRQQESRSAPCYESKDERWAALYNHELTSHGESNRSWDVADAASTRLARKQRSILQGNGIRSTYSRWWATEPQVDRVVNGVPSRVDRLRGLGNAVVPQVAEYVGRCILDAVKMERAGVA